MEKLIKIYSNYLRDRIDQTDSTRQQNPNPSIYGNYGYNPAPQVQASQPSYDPNIQPGYHSGPLGYPNQNIQPTYPYQPSYYNQPAYGDQGSTPNPVFYPNQPSPNRPMSPQPAYYNLNPQPFSSYNQGASLNNALPYSPNPAAPYQPQPQPADSSISSGSPSIQNIPSSPEQPQQPGVDFDTTITFDTGSTLPQVKPPVGETFVRGGKTFLRGKSQPEAASPQNSHSNDAFSIPEAAPQDDMIVSGGGSGKSAVVASPVENAAGLMASLESIPSVLTLNPAEEVPHWEDFETVEGTKGWRI
jgi:hypothetical protein